MNYIVLDMEWNQPMYARPAFLENLPCRLEGEIIQIGAFKLNDQLEQQDSFNVDIRPVYFKKMNRKVEELTGFNAERLRAGMPFPEAAKDFLDFCGEEFCLLTWGADDVRLLRENLTVHGLESDWLEPWYNLQVIYNIQTESDHQQKSLETALKFFDIPQDLPAHDAYYDAYYTVKICQKLDIKKGIAEYPSSVLSKAKEEKAPELDRKFIKGYPSIKAILTDKRLQAVLCPDCKKTLASNVYWTRQGNNKFFSLIHCDCHGDYVVRLTVTKAGKKRNASRCTQKIDAEALARYEEKIQKERERAEKRRQRSLEARQKEAQTNVSEEADIV